MEYDNLEYLQAVRYSSDGVYICKKEDFCGVYNVNDDKVLIPFKYDYITYNNHLFTCEYCEYFDLYETDDNITNANLVHKNIQIDWCFPYGVGEHFKSFYRTENGIIPLSKSLVCVPAYLMDNTVPDLYFENNVIDNLSNLIPLLASKACVKYFVDQHPSEYREGKHQIEISPIRFGLYQIIKEKKLSVRMLLPHKYDELKLREDGLLDVRIENRWGIASTELGEVTAIKYAKPITSMLVQDANSKLFGYLSKTYKTELLTTNYQDILFPSCYVEDYGKYIDYSKVPYAVGKYGTYQQYGEHLVNDEYVDEYYRVIDIKYAVIDSKFNIISDYIYDDVHISNKVVWAQIGKQDDGTYKTIDVYCNDKLILTYHNCNIWPYVSGKNVWIKVKLKKSKLYRLESLQSRWVSSNYHNIQHLSNGIFCAYNSKNALKIISEGSETGRFEYILITNIVNGYAFAVTKCLDGFDVWLIDVKKRTKIVRVYEGLDLQEIIYKLETNALQLVDKRKQLYVNSLEGSILPHNNFIKEDCTICSSEFIDYEERSGDLIYWRSLFIDLYIQKPKYCWDSNSSKDAERDTWWAMTGGQYGDYPGGDIDYDVFGF